MARTRCRICGSRVRSRESGLCPACEDEVSIKKFMYRIKDKFSGGMIDELSEVRRYYEDSH